MEKLTEERIAKCFIHLIDISYSETLISDYQWYQWMYRAIKLKRFYSQPFSPFMLASDYEDEELFEGWEGEKNMYFTNEDYYIVIGEKCWMRNNKLAEPNYMEPLMPQTLDQFISDCSRLHIPLIWKESVFNKYFK